MSITRQFPRRARGFTLVETLVALVVMAVGMLGIAGLYVESLQAGRTSMLRTTAVTLAADMADRIRANPQAIGGYAGAGPGVGADNNCVNGIANCTPGQMALDDWFWWENDVRNRLPAGSTAVIAVAANPVNFTNRYTITLSWPETGAPQPASYVLEMEI